MVNHTIHTCEQRVRFPLSAFIEYRIQNSSKIEQFQNRREQNRNKYIFILFIIPHIHKPTHIYSPDPNKNHITISLYNISVSILHSLLQNQNYIFIFSYHTHYYFLPNIYILSYLLLITTTIYIPTYNQNTPLSQIDRYISYIHNYYLLTYTENRTHLSIHLFHPTIV